MCVCVGGWVVVCVTFNKDFGVAKGRDIGITSPPHYKKVERNSSHQKQRHPNSNTAGGRSTHTHTNTHTYTHIYTHTHTQLHAGATDKSCL